MFRRILIANRGEIAVRVIRSARAMGVETVAVYSDADRGSAHVALADHAVHIGGAAAAESYLNIPAIVAACKATGSEAVHPGYGFLSENAGFARALAENGIVFIGPSVQAIELMGQKDAAKTAMEQAGVPVLPGYQGDDQSDSRLLAEARRIGFPVLIKATSGGGGRGMRRVMDAGQFNAALESARAEAKSAFGDDRMIIEHYVAAARHIEVQVFGDGKSAVHLYERDCSLQRRHQKVIEEAPAPGMTPEMRAALGGAAVKAAEVIGYSGAGTVEFIADAGAALSPDRFWFLEMNTRLQVEHPVTEAITGLDLVEWQLRVAAGEALPLRQDQITLNGHAVEVRLYAEDPAHGFRPSPGRLSHLRFPADARIDSGIRAGDRVSPWYDPMIAKIITWGQDREAAFAAMDKAMAETELAGIESNLGFLRNLNADTDVRAGHVDTGLIERKLDALAARPSQGLAEIAQAALVLGGLMSPHPQAGFALWQPLTRRLPLICGGDRIEVTLVSISADRHELTINGQTVVAQRAGGEWRFAGGAPRVMTAIEAGVLDRASGRIYAHAPLGADAAGTAGGPEVISPMPGLLRRHLVAEGAMVEAGQAVAVLEAMKLEHIMTAAIAGRVSHAVAEGTRVSENTVLARIDADV